MKTMDATRLGADLWYQLPASWRARAQDAAQRRYGDVFEDVAGAAGPWWPLRPLVLSEVFHQELGLLSDRLAVLVLETCLRRASTAGELLNELGMPPEQVPLLVREERLGEHLLAALRADIVVDHGVPKFVEINIDGAVGGTAQADLVSTRFRSVYVAELPEVSLAVPPSAVDARFTQIRKSFDGPGEVNLAIPMYEHGILAGATSEFDRIRRHKPMIDSARRLGITAVPCPWRDMTNDAQSRLLVNGKPFDAVLRLFITGAEPASEGLSALTNAVHHGTVQMHTPEASWLLSSKTVLAWLWADIDRLDPADQHLVRTHVPWTAILGSDCADLVREAIADRPGWVLKPAHGHGGTGVVLGPSVSQETWRNALRDAVRTEDHILQRLVQADALDMTFYNDRTDSIHREAVPFVLGPFLFDRQVSNVVVRHGMPGGGQVVNAQQGSVLNSILIAPQQGQLL